MHTLTARIDDQLFEATKKQAQLQGLVMSEYLRTALKALNAEYAKQARYHRLQAASLSARAISMEVNAEFDAFEGDDFD